MIKLETEDMMLSRKQIEQMGNAVEPMNKSKTMYKLKGKSCPGDALPIKVSNRWKESKISMIAVKSYVKKMQSKIK